MRAHNVTLDCNRIIVAETCGEDGRAYRGRVPCGCVLHRNEDKMIMSPSVRVTGALWPHSVGATTLSGQAPPYGSTASKSPPIRRQRGEGRGLQSATTRRRALGQLHRAPPHPAERWDIPKCNSEETLIACETACETASSSKFNKRT